MSNARKKRKRANPKRFHKALTGGTVVTIIGLLIGLIGLLGLVDLRSKMSVTPQEPIEKSQPFTVPFRIDNTGLLSFTVEHVYCYVGDAKSQSPNVKIDIGSFVIGYSDWDNVTLESDGGGTLTCKILKVPNMQDLINADITIVIDYKPFGFPASYRKYYRFTGAYVDNWQWVRKPVDDIKKDVDAGIKARTSKPS